METQRESSHPDSFDDLDTELDEYDAAPPYPNEPYYPYEPADAELDQPSFFSSFVRVTSLVAASLLLFLVMGVAAWLLGQRSSGSSYSMSASTSAGAVDVSKLPTGVRVGALPPDFTLNEFNTGKPITLSKLRGSPVWVNFWATWCPPCRAEMPEMKQRYEKYKDKGLVILGVDVKEDNATVKQFTALGGYNWTFVIDGAGEVEQQYFVTGIPTHIFVDKSGVIRSITVGGISGGMMDDALKQIIQ